MAKKRISERDYIICTNLAKVRIAFSTIKDLCEGKEYGVPDEEHEQVRKTIYQWMRNLEKIVNPEST